MGPLCPCPNSKKPMKKMIYVSWRRRSPPLVKIQVRSKGDFRITHLAIAGAD
ncbi:unnamed protein product [Staurois parvus]|uniref:Uncharacterized protein n=1 Tax=Staurois parvus TaxID=386267 RepID=A0ABN9CZF6_9NEOB|nr:unnamed protein product [Staurois parvus]